MLFLLRDKLFPVLVFLHAVLAGAPARHGGPAFERLREYRVQTLPRLPRAVRESSGLARADSAGLWTHGDGGTGPRLYELGPPGTLRRQLSLAPLPNVDWEDLAQDLAGNLYVGDFGNNRSARRDLRIYRLRPGTGAGVDTIAFRYPDQQAFPPARRRRNFDCEAFFFADDSLHLFSKDRGPGHWVKYYVLPARPGRHVARLRDSLRLNTIITGADLSPDGRTVALLGYGAVFLFERQPGRRLFAGARQFRALPRTGQAEGMLFVDDRQLLISNERGQLYRLEPRH